MRYLFLSLFLVVATVAIAEGQTPPTATVTPVPTASFTATVTFTPTITPANTTTAVPTATPNATPGTGAPASHVSVLELSNLRQQHAGPAASLGRCDLYFYDSKLEFVCGDGTIHVVTTSP